MSSACHYLLITAGIGCTHHTRKQKPFTVCMSIQVGMASNIYTRVTIFTVLVCILLMQQASGHERHFHSYQNKTRKTDDSGPKSTMASFMEHYGLTSTVAAPGNLTSDGSGSQQVYNAELKTLIFFGGLLIIMLRILCL